MLFFFFIIIITVIIIRLQLLVYLIWLFFFRLFASRSHPHLTHLYVCMYINYCYAFTMAFSAWPRVRPSSGIWMRVGLSYTGYPNIKYLLSCEHVCVCLYIEPYELCTKWEYGMMSRLPIRQAHNRIWFSSLYTDCQLVCFANENRLRWRRRQH